MNHLNSINSKQIPEKKSEKIVNILEKILDFNKKQKPKDLRLDLAKCIKILTSKQMLQKLTIVSAQVKAGNTCENFLNEVRQNIFCLYQPKEIAKKVHNSNNNNNKFKISAPAWNEEFELLDG